ncbi:hypothetical protein [[Pseudopropionibacterium] massiliense]|uniref:hypothetical protein n=1 Tax=[Pseudopropionibacterium] massiliense TaxID=2220000 RepID=UPI0010303C67|nr:hypothetical protein [[Pseudopropionibacterium] massiliense]
MTNHPNPTPEEATDMLRQAETALTRTRGIAGWPTIATQMSMGAATSVYLLANRDTDFDAVSFVGMMVWILAPMILVVAFAKVAKNGFAVRWGVYMAVWALCWGISMLFPTAVVRVPLAVVIAVTSFVGALVEARR